MKFIPVDFSKAVSFGVAVAEHVAAGMPMATEEQKIARLEICRACDQFDSDRAACKFCGCNMDTKAGWADQACPIAKWGPVTATRTPSDTR